MTTLSKLLIIAMMALINACGSDSTSELQAQQSPTFTNEYDPHASTRVTGWRIEQTFQFDATRGTRRLAIQNVDAVTEVMQVYIGSGSRPRYHVYVITPSDFGKITERLRVIDRLQPMKVKADYAIKVGQNPNGDFVYRLSLPVEAPYRSEIYAEMEDFDGSKHWSNQGRPNSYSLISFQNYLPK